MANEGARTAGIEWNCVGCDATGQAEIQADTSISDVLAEVRRQHFSLKPECPLIYNGRPALAIWEQ